MGMVNAVVPFDKLEETTVDWAKTIMKRSPFAIRMIKRALNAELDGQHGLMEFAWRRHPHVLHDGRSAGRQKRIP